MDQRIDRRGFLAGAGALGVSLASAGTVGAAARRAARASGPPIRGQVIRRGAAGFAQAAHVYNELYDGVLPNIVARPQDAADVRVAIRWGVAHGVPMRARSGGHSYAGYSTLSGGMVLDLRQLRAIRIDTRHRTATIGAGAQLIDVYAALAARGLTIPAGSCPSVGIAGHALGGGMGLAGRRFGLTADNLLGAQIVTADGRLRIVNAHTHPDLFWALRGGGGGNFGVVTSFTFRVHPVPPTVAGFTVTWPWSQAAEALAAWQAWAPHASTAVTSIFHLTASAGRNHVNVSGQYFGPASDLAHVLAPLKAVGGAVVSAGDFGYLQAQLRWAGCSHISLTGCHTQGTRRGGIRQREKFQATSDYVATPLPVAACQTLVRAAQARLSASGHGAILFDSYGGAIKQIKPAATAFVHRNALFCIQYLSYDGDAAWLSATAARMRPYVTGGAYLNYTDPGLKHWQRAYYGSNYRRLLKIRREVDPHQYFDFPQAIGR